MAEKAISLVVNGRRIELKASARRRLLDVLREDLRLTGTKEGCGGGDCGACSVLIDGVLAKACQTPIGQAAGKRITTIEGLGSPQAPHALQRAFVQYGAVQCGFCTPGMIMAASSLLARNPNPSHQQVVEALSGNLCRCTGYVKIIQAVLGAAGTLRGEAQPQEELPRLGGVGVRVPRRDGLAKATGTHPFAADLFREGMLYAQVLRSQHAHARILGIDTSEAARLPGVEAVLTHRDVPGSNRHGSLIKDQPVLADDKVRWYGDPVAVVAAHSPEIAKRALSRIKVDYQPLEVVSDPFLALQEGAPLVHEKGNLLRTQRVVKGDLQEGFRRADVIVENTYTTPYIEHAYLEPEAGLAYLDEEGRVVIHACTQNPHKHQRDVAAILGLPPQQVRIIPPTAGGAFGGKGDLSVHPYVALLAHRLKRPVKMVLSRRESFLATTKRHPFYIRCRTGATRDGRLTAHQMEYVMNKGAYASAGPITLVRAAIHGGGPYVIPHIFIEGKAVYTNSSIGGAMRGFGAPQLQFAVESQMDILARKLGIDPLEFRLINGLRQGSQTITGQVPASVGFPATLQAIAPYYHQMAVSVREFNQGSNKVKRGLGLGCMWYGIGKTATSNRSEAVAELTRQGRVRVLTGTSDMGQGTYTVLAQIAAQEMGLPFDGIDVIGGDTDLTPDAQEAAASRQTYISGNAVREAAGRLRTALLSTAARVLERKAADLAFQDDHVASTSDPQVRVSLQELGAYCREADIPLSYKGAFDPAVQEVNPLTGQGTPFETYSSGCQLAEVEVDLVSGAVGVLRVVNAQDVGKAINPLNVEGQLQGAVVMGLGFGLKEEFIPGKTRSFRQYAIPTTRDVPQITPIIIEEPEPSGPFGAKGAGEAAMIPTAPAILNAIYDACGVRLFHLPATPQRLRKALKEQRGG